MIDQDGSFSVKGVPPGSNQFMIRFTTSDGPEHAVVSFEIPDQPELYLNVEIPGGTISGTVADASSGFALSGVRLTLIAEKSSRRGGLGFRGGSKSANTGEKGTFIFRKLTAGSYRIRAHPSDSLTGAHGTGYFPANIKVELEEEAALEGVRLALSPGGGVRVTVRDDEGKAVKWALVKVSVSQEETSPVRQPGNQARTDEDGLALLTGLKPGLYEVSVQAQNKGYLEVESIEVRAERIIDVEVALEEGFEVTVRLLDGSGLPVDNADLTLRDSRGRQLNVTPRRGWSSGGSNIYTLGFLTAGSYTLEAKWKGGTGQAIFSVSGHGEIDLVLRED
jgi:hypothetical protein